MNKNELLDLLKDYGISIENWGKGEAKTIGHLIGEVVSGEASVVLEDGHLTRVASGVVVSVYFCDEKRTLELREEKQVFRDGRERRRDLDGSLGEKYKPGESPCDGVHRALSEELGITESLPFEFIKKDKKGPVPSISYPGLMTVYHIDYFQIFLPLYLFKPEGYREVQSDKTTYFVWKEVAG